MPPSAATAATPTKALKRTRSDSPESDCGSEHSANLLNGLSAADEALLVQAEATPKNKRSQEHRDVIKRARMIRNRVAAQSSRDKKRRTMEDLENTNKVLTDRLAGVERSNALLISQVAALAKTLASFTSGADASALMVPSPSLTATSAGLGLSPLPSPAPSRSDSRVLFSEPSSSSFGWNMLGTVASWELVGLSWKWTGNAFAVCSARWRWRNPVRVGGRQRNLDLSLWADVSATKLNDGKGMGDYRATDLAVVDSFFDFGGLCMGDVIYGAAAVTESVDFDQLDALLFPVVEQELQEGCVGRDTVFNYAEFLTL
ncbi:hypothetical protein BC830DRAFT_1193216 [Chytriomyces sp. MP71]|nr:hypothetical protein BC830DRAFT_1193216 [Chytriomyces sp. MP71]